MTPDPKAAEWQKWTKYPGMIYFGPNGEIVLESEALRREAPLIEKELAQNTLRLGVAAPQDTYPVNVLCRCKA